MFVDTNVLVYALDNESDWHDRARASIDRARRAGEPLRISRQVVREFISTLTRQSPGVPLLSREIVLEEARRLLQSYEVLEDGPRVTEILLDLCGEIAVGGRQVHDASIVATMRAHDESRLLTFNATDFVRYADHIELVPV